MNKKIIFCLTGCLLLSIIARSQEANTFPLTGNVGIGTSAPSQKLSVLGNISSNVSNSEGGALFLENPLKTSNNQSYRWAIYNMTGSYYGNSLQFWNYSQDGVVYGPKLTLADNGNVGIGTTNPDNQQGWQRVLDVYADSHAKLLVRGNDIKTGIFSDQTWGSHHIGRIGTESSHDLGLMAGYGNIAILLKTNGNVGVGTENPTERLSVNGNIRAKEIKVEAANWPDYVFEADYKITSLTELEKYIQVNKHLPEMPSAKAVEANGVDLGEMVKLQQKKIEELTLHLIEKNKMITESKTELTIQKEKLSKLEQSYDSLNKQVSEFINKSNHE